MGSRKHFNEAISSPAATNDLYEFSFALLPIQRETGLEPSNNRLNLNVLLNKADIDRGWPQSFFNINTAEDPLL
jgi:hypothetical protein